MDVTSIFATETYAKAAMNRITDLVLLDEPSTAGKAIVNSNMDNQIITTIRVPEPIPPKQSVAIDDTAVTLEDDSEFYDPIAKHFYV